VSLLHSLPIAQFGAHETLLDVSEVVVISKVYSSHTELHVSDAISKA